MKWHAQILSNHEGRFNFEGQNISCQVRIYEIKIPNAQHKSWPENIFFHTIERKSEKMEISILIVEARENAQRNGNTNKISWMNS